MALLTQAQLEDLLVAVTVTMTALDPTMIRLEYPANGQPGFLIGQNIAFLNVTEIDDPYNKQRDVTYPKADGTHNTEKVGYTRVMQCAWTLYGPLSYDLGDQIRYAIETEAIRTPLAAQGAFPIPKIAAPLLTRENFDGQWWPRTDLQVQFNVATQRENTVPSMAAAVIQVKDAQGTERVINVTS